LNILYASHSLAPGALLLPTISSGHSTNAISGFQSHVNGLKIIDNNVKFLHFLYFPFATSPAAFSAFLFHLELIGFITTW